MIKFLMHRDMFFTITLHKEAYYSIPQCDALMFSTFYEKLYCDDSTFGLPQWRVDVFNETLFCKDSTFGLTEWCVDVINGSHNMEAPDLTQQTQDVLNLFWPQHHSVNVVYNQKEVSVIYYWNIRY